MSSLDGRVSPGDPLSESLVTKVDHPPMSARVRCGICLCSEEVVRAALEPKIVAVTCTHFQSSYTLGSVACEHSTGIEDIMMILLSCTEITVPHLLGGPRLPRTPSGSTSSFAWAQLLQEFQHVTLVLFLGQGFELSLAPDISLHLQRKVSG